MSSLLVVGISDVKMTKAPGVLITYALGSCIGVCFYDSAIRLGALLHIMLPDAPSKIDNVFKYADTGIAETLRKMESMGGSRSRITAKIAGGAQMFHVPGDNHLGNIGKRNSDSVRMTLLKQRVRMLGADVGGTFARTVEFDTATGVAKVRTYGHPDKDL
ncbi:MAG: chemotaxis protein CheD [Clostridiales bacterium]|nr:chemotaxis protein CheD [Clostridiales bacterium]